MDPQTKQVRTFYNYLNEKCSFVSRVNAENIPPRIKTSFDELSEEVKKRYYGSGIGVPEHLEGARVLDMGCGAGSLVFILSKLVGPKGYVVGVDIASGLIDTAQKESKYHYEKWGYDKPNFEFHCADISNTTELGFELGSFDAVISNGVFCLCPDKSKVFSQAYQMLRPGGQFLLSDVYAEVSQPEDLIRLEKIWCAGIGGLLWNELSPMCQSQGFTVPYLQRAGGINIKDEEMKKVLNNADYLCSTTRLFKLQTGADRGPASVTYLGNLEDYPESLPWDIDLTFKKDVPTAVDGELATVLASTDFANNFSFDDFSGDITTKRNQNPFLHLRGLREKNQAPPFVYEVE